VEIEPGQRARTEQRRKELGEKTGQRDVQQYCEYEQAERKGPGIETPAAT
jgi:hypothetical protein